MKTVPLKWIKKIQASHLSFVEMGKGTPNLDALSHADLWNFYWMCQNSPRLAAWYMYPGHRPNRVKVTRDVKNYASNKATAVFCRLNGDIKDALKYENICERIYQRLPDWAKW